MQAFVSRNRSGVGNLLKDARTSGNMGPKHCRPEEREGSVADRLASEAEAENRPGL
jgi:hypothetical protein